MHSDHFAGWSDVLRPAECRRRLHRYSCFHRWRQDLFPVIVALLFKNIPRWHADHARLDSFCLELLVGSHTQGNFASGSHQNDFRLPVGRIGQNIGSFGDARGGCILRAVKGRDSLPGQYQRRRFVLQLHDNLPRFDDFVGVCRTEQHQAWDSSQLKQAGLVEDRRTGKNAFYRLTAPAELMNLLRQASGEIPEAAQDRAALRLAMRKRQDKMRRYFDELAGKFGRQYVPGRSWKGVAEALLKLMPPMVIADLGAGEGTVSQLMAQRAKRVIAIDNSEKMVEFGSELARRHGINNMEYRLGDLEEVPIRSGTVDLAFLSQALHHARHPERALAESWRILRPGGRIAILDLNRHHFEEAREMYADLWLGFTELELERYLKTAGFKAVDTAVVHRETEAPYFETVLATGCRTATK